ncbi:MAG: GNAT family N-acetyltransferase [Emcibacter sp.]|nr:GNAT family N-acetyltransferase [Emcibacter sp.]
MIEIISQENFPYCISTLEQMYAQRYEIFVKKMKWDLPLSQPGIEKDEYDTAETIYLISKDEKGQINGSLRLSPTHSRSMIEDHFSHLCDSALPKGTDVWEASRCYILPLRGRRSYTSQTMGKILCAAMETSLLGGVKQVNIISNMIVLPALLGAGWNITPLGLPRKDGRKSIVALTIDITPSGLQAVRQKHNISSQITYKEGQNVRENAA